MADENKILEAACAYINANARALHALDNKADVAAITGGDISADDIAAHHIGAEAVMLLIDRGIKGMPKYTLTLASLEAHRVSAKATDEPTAPSTKRRTRTKK